MAEPVSSLPSALPERPNLEHLKNEARRRLKAMRGENPAAKLADAQFRLARDYGFAGWRALKAEVDRLRDGGAPADLARFVGWYRNDPGVVTNSVLEIGCAGARLFIQATGAPRLELLHHGGCRYGVAGTDRRLVFDTAETPAAALVVEDRGVNVRMGRADQAAAEAAQAGFARALADQARPRQEVEIAPERLDALTGGYASALGLDIEISRVGDRLFTQAPGQPQIQIHPESETAFFSRVAPVQIRFRLEGGRAVGLVLAQNGREFAFDRVAQGGGRPSAQQAEKLAEQQKPRTPVPVEAAVLEGYVGRYQLDVQRIVTVDAQDGRLFVQVAGQPRLEVYPESASSFFWTAVPAQIEFMTDGAGRTTHAVIHQYGRDIPMARVAPMARAADEPALDATAAPASTA